LPWEKSLAKGIFSVIVNYNTSSLTDYSSAAALPGTKKMPALFTRFTNDVVSLTVLALMVIAFVAAQAGAVSAPSHGAAGDSPATEQVIAIDHDVSLSNIGE